MSFLLSENMHVTRYRLKKKTMREWNLRGCKKITAKYNKEINIPGLFKCFVLLTDILVKV